MESPDANDLTYLQEQYAKVVEELNERIIELGEIKSKVQQVDAQVKKLTNMQNLILENIRCCKKIMEITR